MIFISPVSMPILPENTFLPPRNQPGTLFNKDFQRLNGFVYITCDILFPSFFGLTQIYETLSVLIIPPSLSNPGI